ncbi:hypothetical protein ABGB18_26170 [Nonomuraea sp. B12E4]
MPLARLIGRLGGLTAVLVGLTLCAIVQQEVTGRPMAQSATQRSAAAVQSHPAARVSGPPGTTPLIDQVQATVTDQWAELVHSAFGVEKVPQPDVHLIWVDQAGGWAFGTCAVPPPPDVDAMPQVSLFVARRTDETWRIGLAGTEDFGRLLRDAPEAVIPAEQRPLLEQYGTAKSGNPPKGLVLPWHAGQSWTVQSLANTSGLRFAGGDGRVLASGPGRVYRLCAHSPGRGMLLLIHPNGTATEYYQVTDLTRVKDGASVRRGEYLGQVSTDRPCGGPSAQGPAAASFTLLSGDGAVSLDGVEIGGWTLHTDGGSFYADRSGMRVESGNPLLNFGTDPGRSSAPRPPAAPAPRSS